MSGMTVRFHLAAALAVLTLAMGCTTGDEEERTGPAPLMRDAAPIEDAEPMEVEPDAGEVTPTDDAGDATADDMGPTPACADGRDNDGDGLRDLNDPGCQDASDDDETDPPVVPDCADGLDNDDDGRIDLVDPDCLGSGDFTEDGRDPVAGCSNRLDDDGDGVSDFPLDPGCAGAGDDDEADPPTPPVCADGVDNDEDGATDYPDDPGCEGRGDTDEGDPDPLPQCANGEDDDGNGAVDYPEDPGCQSAADRSEDNPCGMVDLVDLNAHLEENAAYDGTLVGRTSGLVAVCGGRAGGEVAFTYVVDRLVEQLVFDTRHPETEAPTVVYTRTACVGPDLACDRGNPESPGAAVVLDRPALGRYFVVVDTGSRESVGAFRLTVDPVYPPECRDGIDNDGDGLIDNDDVGCSEYDDPDELDPAEPPVCSNGLDDDGDGNVDYPEDLECLTAGYPQEQPLCDLDIPYAVAGQEGGQFEIEAPDPRAGSQATGSCGGGTTEEGVVVLTLDEPSDVTVETFVGGALRRLPVYARTDCPDAESEVSCRASNGANVYSLAGLDRGVYYLIVEQSEVGAGEVVTLRIGVSSNLRQCNDLLDNDADGQIDLDDPGCTEGLDDDETDPAVPPQCADGQDNDGDGDIDYPDDANCLAAGQDREAPACEFTDDVQEVGPEGGVIMFDTRGDPTTGEASCGGGSPQAVVAITIAERSSLEASIIASNYDTVIHLRSVCDDPATELACDDDTFAPGVEDSQIIVSPLDPGTYFLILDGYNLFGPADGTGTVEIVINPL